MVDVELTAEWRAVIDRLEKDRQSLFLTGQAGTGKSTFLQHFRKQTKKRLVVLSPTGLAAVNIQGETIHSFFRFSPNITTKEAKQKGHGCDDPDVYVEVDILVIDEISMVRADLLDCVDQFLRAVTRSPLPFGGKQMLFIGDLFQLPPILTDEEKPYFLIQYRSPYFFDAHCLAEMNLPVFELTQVFRQKDPVFLDVLNAVRRNECSATQLARLNGRLDMGCIDRQPHAIVLTTTNKMAESINLANLSRIKNPEHRFQAKLQGQFNPNSAPTYVELVLKKDAQVMFVNNDRDKRWVNGSMGVIIEIRIAEIDIRLADSEEIVTIQPYAWEVFKTVWNEEEKELEKKVLGSFTQFPIKLAWSITIHKSQGQTFDKAIIHLGSGSFCHGQTYVALSRCRSLEGLQLRRSIRPSDIILDPCVVEFHKGIADSIDRETARA